MAQTIIKILTSIAFSLVTEKIVKTVIATGLEVLVNSTKNDIDDKFAKPIIEELRK